MKERPILFSGPMVRALRDGSKTQTRRVVKPAKLPAGHWMVETRGSIHEITHWDSDTAETSRIACPYGQPGDRLWVRETFFAWGHWEKRYSVKKGRDEWHFVDMAEESGNGYLYAADGVSDTMAFIKRRSDPKPMYWKRPAIFMPRAASRITLEITRVRVERLQDISSRDAIAEGIEACPIGGEWRNYLDSAPNRDALTPRVSFRSLWESINGPDSWDANPWVWVVEFRRLP